MTDNSDDLEPLAVGSPPSSWSPSEASAGPGAAPGPDWWASPPPPGPNEPSSAGGSGRRGLLIAALILAMVFAGIGGYAITARVQDNSDNASASRNGNGNAQAPNNPPADSTDRDAPALNDLDVRQRDIGRDYGIALLPNGNTLKEPTLDLCNGTFPSEKLRTARRQVAEAQTDETLWLSTEAVLYRNADATTQAFKEIRDVASHCPNRPVPSPSGGDRVTTIINPPPDRSWKSVDGVERLAYDTTMVSADGQRTRNVVVYMRRGRAFLGVYFPKPDGAQPAVGGQKTIEGIAHEFAQRLAALDAAVVNRPSPLG